MSRPKLRAEPPSTRVRRAGLTCLLVLSLAVPRLALAEAQPLDPYAGPPPPPPPVLPIAPPRPVPPLLPIAPPRPVPPVLPIAPPVAPPVLPVAPPGAGPIYVHPPRLTPAPEWNGGGCPVGCEGYAPVDAPLHTPTSPAHVDKRPRYGLLSAGLSVLGGLWLISASTGILAERHALAIPIAGPFITASDIGHEERASPGRTMVIGMLAMDGIFQTVGLIMAIAGGASRVAVTKRPPPRIYPAGVGIYGHF